MNTHFDYYDLDEPWDGFKKWTFSCAMVSACSPLLDKCDDNHEVEALLRENGVIHANNQTDTESCQMYVYFSSKKSGEKFIDRLNTYLKSRENLMEEHRL